MPLEGEPARMPMPLQLWAELITRQVRERISDPYALRAVRAGTKVTWTLGTCTATLDAAEPGLWWIIAGCRTHCENADARAARVMASNILVHFDSRWCRGIDVEPPYQDAVIKRPALGY